MYFLINSEKILITVGIQINNIMRKACVIIAITNSEE
jgi:hypothetical protein